MGLLTHLNKATESYHRRLVEQLKPFISDHTFEHAHRRARAHAGGKASPKREAEPTFMDRASLMAALSDGVLEVASDEDLERMHGMVHRLFVQKDNNDDTSD
jgi:hypothetical protein